MSNFKNDDDLNEKMLDEITRRVVEESKDKKHSNDDGMENDYDFMRTEIEGELIALGFARRLPLFASAPSAASGRARGRGRAWCLARHCGSTATHDCRTEQDEATKQHMYHTYSNNLM